MTKTKRLVALGLLACAATARAQLTLPTPVQLPTLGDVPGRVRGGIEAAAEMPRQAVRRLDAVRRARIADLVRANPDRIALDRDGFPARAGEVVVDDADDALVAKATAAGYAVIERGDILGIGFARLAAPRGRTLKAAIRDLEALGATQVSADPLHVQNGVVAGTGRSQIVGISAITRGATAWLGDRTADTNAGKAMTDTAATPAIGVIDGGAGGAVAGQRGFAAGAPRASDHGSAVASLIVGRGSVRGAAPAARLYVADVYGGDPAGGNAVAIAKALGWLVGERVPVVTISLVGPPNPLLGRVVAAAQRRGTIIVAAVGNDGPAAPPAYPASYPGVVAVTAVDARGRVLIEAGRATHLDYAAPGADMLAATAAGHAAPVRGTSFAAPLVAATIARVYPAQDGAAWARALKAVDAAAKPGARYGRGLVCATCRTPPR